MKGFDRYRRHRWQMVPLNGTRYIIVRDGAGLTISGTHPHRLRVSEIAIGALPSGHLTLRPGDRFIKLEGAGHGSAEVRLTDGGGSIVKRLQVNVKRRKTVNVSFNFVRDNAGHQTARVPAAATGWVRAMHYIYSGQANIAVRLSQARWVNVAQNLGTRVMFTSHIAAAPAGSHEWGVVTATGDAGAHLNFFLVWDYEQDFDPTTDTDAGTLGGDCIFEDSAGTQIGETMAHEMGHYLGAGDHYIVARRRELMYGITDTRGVHIPKADANIMNP